MIPIPIALSTCPGSTFNFKAGPDLYPLNRSSYRLCILLHNFLQNVGLGKRINLLLTSQSPSGRRGAAGAADPDAFAECRSARARHVRIEAGAYSLFRVRARGPERLRLKSALLLTSLYVNKNSCAGAIAKKINRGESPEYVFFM
ncbi:hypothetical protein EVAR_31914_1 [Eumeta japonica]|uniref:Uncharacterized protein n=1 Tax=Eumeta variegata TaxID=151549 RepID=A0A4C1XP65_EUMVA|nr:hypothetical protein EVAR_31914_1 [Eumeta japonica]